MHAFKIAMPYSHTKPIEQEFTEFDHHQKSLKIQASEKNPIYSLLSVRSQGNRSRAHFSLACATSICQV